MEIIKISKRCDEDKVKHFVFVRHEYFVYKFTFTVECYFERAEIFRCFVYIYGYKCDIDVRFDGKRCKLIRNYTLESKLSANEYELWKYFESYLNEISHDVFQSLTVLNYGV